MTTRWFIRQDATNRFLATGGFSLRGPNTIGWVERFQDAASFDTRAQAIDVAVWLAIPDALSIVDYFDHPPLPPDSEQRVVETYEQRKERVRAEEAVRLRIRGLWTIKTAAAATALAMLMLAVPRAEAVPFHTGAHQHARSVHHGGIAHTQRAARRHRVAFRHHSVRRLHGPAGIGGSAVAGGGPSLLGVLTAPFTAAGSAVAAAARYVGTNPTGKASLWCADFVNLIERKLGRPGTGSREAKSFLRYGRPISIPQPGDIVVFNRRGGGHVGYYVSGPATHPVVVSGNDGHRVRVRQQSLPVVAYVRP